MDSPNRMANIITGRNDSMGPGPPTWKTAPNQPHWNTATRTPNAAPMERRFITAAVRGMTMLRNTMDSRRKESSTTRPMNRGSFDPSTRAKSTKIAVLPPTKTRTPVPATTAGMVAWRRWSMRSVVAAASGDELG